MTDHAISGETFPYFDRHCLDNTISAIGVSLLFYKDYFSLPRNIFYLGIFDFIFKFKFKFKYKIKDA